MVRRWDNHPMKRTFAVVAFLASLGVLLKLASRPLVPSGPSRSSAVGPVVTGSSDRAETVSTNALLRKYRTAPRRERALVERLSDRFGRNAEAIERTDGLRGLVLLDRLD